MPTSRLRHRRRAAVAGRAWPHQVARLVVWLASMASIAGAAGSQSVAAKLFAGVFFVRAAVLLAVAVRYGQRAGSRLDVGALLLAVVALVTYVASGSGAVAVAVGITADVLGYVPTFVKLWSDRRSEDAGFFAIEGMASLCAVLAVGRLTLGVAFPAYFVLANAAVLLLMFRPHFGSTPSAERSERSHRPTG